MSGLQNIDSRSINQVLCFTEVSDDYKWPMFDEPNLIKCNSGAV